MTCGSTCCKFWALAVGGAGGPCFLWPTHLFPVNSLFSLKLADALTPPQPCLFACFAVRFHGVLETHNEMGVVSEKTCIELSYRSEPSSQCPPREQRGEYHCWAAKWNQLIELWHSSRGMVKHHGISVYKIEGENIQQKIQKPTIPCEILFLNQKSRAFSETWCHRYLTFHHYFFFSFTCSRFLF